MTNGLAFEYQHTGYYSLLYQVDPIKEYEVGNSLEIVFSDRILQYSHKAFNNLDDCSFNFKTERFYNKMVTNMNFFVRKWALDSREVTPQAIKKLIDSGLELLKLEREEYHKMVDTDNTWKGYTIDKYYDNNEAMELQKLFIDEGITVPKGVIIWGDPSVGNSKLKWLPCNVSKFDEEVKKSLSNYPDYVSSWEGLPLDIKKAAYQSAIKVVKWAEA